MKIILIEDCLTEEQKQWWEKGNDETKREIAQNIVNKGIKEDINFEVWGEVIYHSLSHCIKTNKNPCPLSCEGLLVSNLGRIYSKKTEIINDQNDHCISNSYNTIYLKDHKRSVFIHRLVANVFCPRPKRHKNTPLSSLVVNHINGVKTDNEYHNLEWVTQRENQIHALKTGLKVPLKGINHKKSIPMKGTVVSVKGHEGKVIYVCGGDDYEQFNLEPSNLYKVRENKLSIHRGCKWEVCSIKDYLVNCKNNCLELAKAMQEHVVKITYILSNIETGESLPELAAREYRDLYGFNETHFQHTWGIGGSIKGHTIRKFEDGEEVYPEPKEVISYHWVLVGIDDKDVIKLIDKNDLDNHGFKYNNIKRNFRMSIPTRHPVSKKLYKVYEYKTVKLDLEKACK